MSFSLKK